MVGFKMYDGNLKVDPIFVFPVLCAFSGFLPGFFLGDCGLDGRGGCFAREMFRELDPRGARLEHVGLDKITDLAVLEGPLLRHFGLCSLKIETAGGGEGSSMGQAGLPGIVDALEFRDKVLEQRDLVAGGVPAPASSS